MPLFLKGVRTPFQAPAVCALDPPKKGAPALRMSARAATCQIQPCDRRMTLGLDHLHYCAVAQLGAS